MTQLVNYSFEGGVATLTLQNGKVNAISPDLVADFNQALDRAEQDKAVVVITGHAGMLSGGYDLNVMKESEQAAKSLVKLGSSLSRRLLAFPYPVIVACSGHAIAKGAFILLSADYRIGVEGPFKIGLNEVAIGMTMHNVGIELARARLSKAAFGPSVICAELCDPEQAQQYGYLDKVVAPEQLADVTAAVAGTMVKLDMHAHHQTKLKARAELLALLDESIEKDYTTPFDAKFS